MVGFGDVIRVAGTQEMTSAVLLGQLGAATYGACSEARLPKGTRTVAEAAKVSLGGEELASCEFLFVATTKLTMERSARISLQGSRT